MTTKLDVQKVFSFDSHFNRAVDVDFSGGHLSSDGGALLLRQVDNKDGISESFSKCFTDRRDVRYCDHSIRELVAQRIIGIVLGYKDLNDHDFLRSDPLFAMCCNKRDVLGEQRIHDDKPMASSVTLNRIEVGTQRESKYHKIHADLPALQLTLLEKNVSLIPAETTEITLDFDNSDNTLHGEQVGGFFHGYYDSHCYLPLYCFAGKRLLWAELLLADESPVKSMIIALPKIIETIRKRFPNIRIIVRCDSGFCREEIFALCEDSLNLFYVVGMAGNCRLRQELDNAFFDAKIKACLCGCTTRVFHSFLYKTKDTWSRQRRMIGKAEILGDKDNARYIVTNLPEDGWDQPSRFSPQNCYENFYCQRGDAENNIKQQQLDLAGTRSSSHWMEANQLRLLFSAFAYLMIEQLRVYALEDTKLATATAGTIRTKLLKIAAHVIVTCRRIYVRMSSAFPLKDTFCIAARRLQTFTPLNI